MEYQKNLTPWFDKDNTFTFIKGRAALYAILCAAGIGRGDEVLMPGFTCVVVPAAVGYTGATPRYYDISPTTLNGDPELAALGIREQTKAIIIQHSFGIPAGLGDLKSICHDRDIVLIEDCAHALGASIGGRPTGLLGDAAFTSFQWSKPITTGLGGMARINRRDILERMPSIIDNQFDEPSLIKSLELIVLAKIQNIFSRPEFFWASRDAYRFAGKLRLVHGSSSTCELESPEMPEQYCELFGRHRLRVLDSAMEELSEVCRHRSKISELYSAWLKGLGCYQPTIPDSAHPVILRHPVLVRDRGRIMADARSKNIELGDWFNATLHPAGCNPEAFGYRPGMCPVGEFSSAHIINLPTHKHISVRQAERTMAFLRNRRHELLDHPPSP